MKYCAIETKELEDKLLIRFAKNQKDELLEDAIDYINNTQQKITQLTNNWNELEDAIDNEVNYYIEDEDAEWFEAKKIQNIMKEIK